MISTLYRSLVGIGLAAFLSCSENKPSGCQRDVDCREPRVCVEGACVDPHNYRPDQGLETRMDAGRLDASVRLDAGRLDAFVRLDAGRLDAEVPHPGYKGMCDDLRDFLEEQNYGTRYHNTPSSAFAICHNNCADEDLIAQFPENEGECAAIFCIIQTEVICMLPSGPIYYAESPPIYRRCMTQQGIEGDWRDYCMF